MEINQEIMKSAFESLSQDLGNGFVASEVWAIGEGRPLIRDHGYNDNPKVAPLFNEVTRKLYKTLQESAYPGLGNYYLVNLDNNHLVVVITIGKLQQFILVDLAKTSMGILMSVALPNLVNILTEGFAVKESIETESPAKAESPAKSEAAISQVSNTIIADYYEESLRAIKEAAEQGMVLRLIGGLGIRHISPGALKPPWKRPYKGIDFVASKTGKEGLEAFFEGQGYVPNKKRNLFFGDKRLLFYDQNNNRQVDIFISVLDMCHFLDLEERLRLTDVALTPEDLFLTKIQIVELNEKDVMDLGVLLLDTVVSEDKEKGGFDPQYVARLCANNWGWFRTATKNIDELKTHINRLEEASSREKEKIIGNLETIEKAIYDHPKSLSWKSRNAIGDKVRWYNLPEDFGYI